MIILPIEQSKKILVMVREGYPFQKELGEHHRVSLDTNRQGGVLVPFIRYAEASHDPDLEFFDPDTKERLGIYQPPKDTQTLEIEMLLKGIKDIISGTTENKYDKVIMELKDLIKVDQTEIKTEGSREETYVTIEDILNIPWKERVEKVKDIESEELLDNLKCELESKSSLGKTNKEVLKIIKEKLGEI